MASAQDLARALAAQFRKPKVALTIAAALAVVVVLLLITSGGGEQPSKLAIAGSGPTAAPAATTTAAVPAAGRIKVASAQSHCPPGSTPGMDAFDAQPGKAWSCVRAYSVDGQVLRIDLGKTYEIDSIGLVPGWDKIGSDGVDQWSKYRTASEVSYRFDDVDGSLYRQATLDQRTLVVTELKPPVRASQVVLTVLKSRGDPGVNTVAISSIVINGH
ncbi:discoidin domain-containing protein [Nocardia colli]|uniref:Discoidin domain-containing protein n=2 Tax=Nocardia colli TaxID=2545717 RepID=A0A5N0DYG0_9NOCA|nr:discoidin domain-containing protein [Nocardia colli]